MKITKQQTELFLVMYDRLVRKLREDLSTYKRCAAQSLQDHDINCFDLNDPKDLLELAELFFYHRIETFKEREAGDPAIDEVLKILNGK